MTIPPSTVEAPGWRLCAASGCLTRGLVPASVETWYCDEHAPFIVPGWNEAGFDMPLEDPVCRSPGCSAPAFIPQFGPMFCWHHWYGLPLPPSRPDESRRNSERDAQPGTVLAREAWRRFPRGGSNYCTDPECDEQVADSIRRKTNAVRYGRFLPPPAMTHADADRMSAGSGMGALMCRFGRKG